MYIASPIALVWDEGGAGGTESASTDDRSRGKKKKKKKTIETEARPVLINQFS